MQNIVICQIGKFAECVSDLLNVLLLAVRFCVVVYVSLVNKGGSGSRCQYPGLVRFVARLLALFQRLYSAPAMLRPSLCTEPSSKGGKGLCNYEPKLADCSRFLESNLCSIAKGHVIMQLQETHACQ